MKPENKSVNKKDLFVILILIVMVIGVIMVIFNSSNKPESWTYNDLYERVENEDVKKYLTSFINKDVDGYFYIDYFNNIINEFELPYYKHLYSENIKKII